MQNEKNFLSLRMCIVFVRLNERDLIYLLSEFMCRAQLLRSIDLNQQSTSFSRHDYLLSEPQRTTHHYRFKSPFCFINLIEQQIHELFSILIQIFLSSSLFLRVSIEITDHSF